MWMADRQNILPEESAQLGQVTLAGASTGVALAGERRNVVLCAPGGYRWTPERGDTVLVIKSGAEQTGCVAGAICPEEEAPEPGEVYLSVAKGAGIRLKKNGRIEIEGDLRITGSLTVNGRQV